MDKPPPRSGVTKNSGKTQLSYKVTTYAKGDVLVEKEKTQQALIQDFGQSRWQTWMASFAVLPICLIVWNRFDPAFIVPSIMGIPAPWLFLLIVFSAVSGIKVIDRFKKF